ncbi:YbdD/YjiX family protein [Homoserinibacter sp. YIM 151385]|uniref:YbdD/YjiX family protein n=1 Tax=Homoserinibacter sp. YIM 151385 TaxID=2985506 RepID=UPI0022F10C6F|nr:YbdD/YjiX family protein [Homoserinibacter sp. YIM 151385]WBU38506.1 YbdD/YjiX family protein [Homoserinibacter sp. YIM 151385]
MPGPGAVRRALRAIRWYVAGVMGETAYRDYVAHLASAHPGQAPPSEREFWAERHRAQELAPGGRCC